LIGRWLITRSLVGYIKPGINIKGGCLDFIAVGIKRIKLAINYLLGAWRKHHLSLEDYE
jgi:hypothetical protein